MPVNAAGQKTVMIDRTLPEIRGTLLKMSRLDILDLCWMIMNIGADLIETDVELLYKMGRLPEGLAFILKAGSVGDLESCGRFRIQRCVLRRPLFEQQGAADIIKREGLFAVLEVRANSIEGIRRLEALKELQGFDVISCIRITGLGRLDTPEWLDAMNGLKADLGKKMDICPDNRFFMGNAIALEAAANGIDYVTTAFSGFGYDRSYAALEMVLSAMKLQKFGTRRINPDLLALLCEQFTKCSRVKTLKFRPGGQSGTISAGELIDA